MSGIEIIFFITVVFIAAASPQIIGFGVSTISMVALSFLFPLPVLLPLVSLISVVSTGVVFLKIRNFSFLRKVLFLLIGSAVGVFIGMLFLNVVSEKILELFFGLFLVTYSIFGLFFSNIRYKVYKLVSVTVGFIAGFFASSFNIQGPFVAAYISSDSHFSKSSMRNSIVAYMFFTGIFTILGHVFFGRVTEFVLTYAFIALPFVLLGSYFGYRIFKIISPHILKKIIYVFILFSGIVLLFS